MESLPTISPMGTLRDVLEALSDPVRLEMVRRMAHEGGPVACSELYDSVSKSTASHHFKVLREAGLTERVTLGGQTHQLQLRLDHARGRHPGVVSSVVVVTSPLGRVPQFMAAPDAAQITRWRRCRHFEDAQSACVPAPGQAAPGRRRHPPAMRDTP